MGATAQGWLVLELTDSAMLLGVVTTVSALPVLLFTLYAGVLADRHDKRTTIIAAQSAALVLALALAVLTGTGRVTVTWIIALVFLLGTASAFEVPTRQAFFVELVGKEDLSNAIALNSAAFNLSRIVGPAIAGILIGTVGMAAAFYLNAFSYVAVLAGLFALKLPPVRRVRPTASAWHTMTEGFDFIRRERVTRTLVGLIALASILAFPYAMLLPVFARDVLAAGAPGLGLLLSAAGAGALAGGITLAATADRIHRGKLLMVAMPAFSLLLVVFALSRSFPLSLALLALAGFAMILNNATVNALLQSLVPDALRGRVMSVYVFMFLGMAPLGSLQAGAMAAWLGAPAALALGAGLLFVISLLVLFSVPELRATR